MVEVLNMPAMANDIRLSTLEPVQQLGSRMAHIFSGELSRLRADSAFSLATGVTLQGVAADGDRIRAEQLSSIGSRLVTLDTAAADESRATREWQDRQVGERDRESSGDSTDTPDSVLDALQDDALILALSQALTAVHSAAVAEGVSGHPIACVLPLAPMLLAFEESLPLSALELNPDPGILILCLAFDGSMGESRRLWGFAYREDCLLGQLEGFWNSSEEVSGVPDDHRSMAWEVSVSGLDQDVTPLHCQRDGEQCRGFRVRCMAGTGEPERWCWSAGAWSWV